MTRNISVGIDLGSSTTRVVVAEFIKGEKNPRIIGVGESETKGVRQGYIVNETLVIASLRSALKVAEATSGIKIKRAFISASGASLRGEWSSGTVIISKADGEVTSLDVNKALVECEENLNLNNKKIIQSFPVSYKLDGKNVLGRLEGMQGTKLEARALLITYSLQHLEDLIEVVAGAGVETIDVIASPVALAHIALSERQKIAGVALVDIGFQTTSISVFENGLPISIHTFPIGGADITHDLAIGFKVPLDQAERLKQGSTEGDFPKKKFEEIISARLSDIFEYIENHLKKIKRHELLPAGIVFVGGGASVPGIEELSKNVLKLPASRGATEMFGTTKTKLRDPAWFTALGLVVSGRDGNGHSTGSFGRLFKDIKSAINGSIKQLMP